MEEEISDKAFVKTAKPALVLNEEELLTLLT
jgi:hypothetical protein